MRKKKIIKYCLRVRLKPGRSNVENLNDDSQLANPLSYCFLYKQVYYGLSNYFNDVVSGLLVFENRQPTVAW